jgi:hypothetical protein
MDDEKNMSHAGLRNVYEIFVLLRCYAVHIDICLPTFQDRLLVQFSGVKGLGLLDQ